MESCGNVCNFFVSLMVLRSVRVCVGNESNVFFDSSIICLNVLPVTNLIQLIGDQDWLQLKQKKQLRSVRYQPRRFLPVEVPSWQAGHSKL